MVCYFTNWSYDREGRGSFVPENMDASLCSHVVYAFATLDSASLEMTVGSEQEDIKTGTYIRQSYPDLKINLTFSLSQLQPSTPVF